MDILDRYGKKGADAWKAFIEREQLNPEQQKSFATYAKELVAWNEKMNLTAITDFPALLADHFQDSLSVARAVTFTRDDVVCDVGSGGGFPGIPLAIKFPWLPIILLEVTQKKVAFLQTMKKELQLDNVTICDLDWRTFIHKAPFNVTYFIARASLRPDELVRAFKSGSNYKQATVIYWASAQWEIGEEEKSFFMREFSYEVEHKKRRLLFFARR